jgi:hypothetical protein
LCTVLGIENMAILHQMSFLIINNISSEKKVVQNLTDDLGVRFFRRVPLVQKHKKREMLEDQQLYKLPQELEKAFEGNNSKCSKKKS